MWRDDCRWKQRHSSKQQIKIYYLIISLKVVSSFSRSFSGTKMLIQSQLLLLNTNKFKNITYRFSEFCWNAINVWLQFLTAIILGKINHAYFVCEIQEQLIINVLQITIRWFALLHWWSIASKKLSQCLLLNYLQNISIFEARFICSKNKWLEPTLYQISAN